MLVMTIPTTNTAPHTMKIDFESLINPRVGNFLSAYDVKLKIPIIARTEPIIPSFTLFQMNGLRMNDFVAPTICMVLMMNLLELIDNRKELLINNMAITAKKPLIINTQKLMVLMFLLTRSTNCES